MNYLKSILKMLAYGFGFFLLILFALAAILTFSRCSTAKVYKQEIHKTKTLVIQPCTQCDQDGGIYLYEIMSKKPLPKPPSIKTIPGAISISRNSTYSYLVAVSPLYDQKNILRKISKIVY